jgi:hypothetical protein
MKLGKFLVEAGIHLPMKQDIVTHYLEEHF